MHNGNIVDILAMFISNSTDADDPKANPTMVHTDIDGRTVAATSGHGRYFLLRGVQLFPMVQSMLQKRAVYLDRRYIKVLDPALFVE